MEFHVTSRFEPRRPLDLALTLSTIGHGAWLRVNGRDAWRATWTPEGAATLHLAQNGAGVEVEAWGDGAAWAAAHAPALCGDEDDDSGFRSHHPLVSELHRRHLGLRLTRTHAVFEALVPAVLAQKVTSVEAHAGYRALVAALGQPAPGPVRMTLPPRSELLARTPYWTFHRFGIERRRADVI